MFANALMSVGWLSLIDPELAACTLELGQKQDFADGDMIYRTDNDQDCLFGVVTGAVKFWITLNEQKPRFGHLAGPGFWFGESNLITGQCRIKEVVAEGETSLLRVERQAIEQIAARGLPIWQAISKLAVMNQGTAIGLADDLMIKNATKRLAAILLRLSGQRNAFQNPALLDTISVTWNELADAACMSRSSVAAILSDLGRRGIVKTKKGQVTVQNAQNLQKILTLN